MTSVTSAMPRVFTPADYEGYIAGVNACYPEYPFSVAEMRHGDETFDFATYFRKRYVIDEGGRIIGGVEATHLPGRFHPDRYRFDLWVVPEARRRGHGTRLYDASIGELVARNAL
ncbi:MAG TPA: GNAT family N-acetyltransferase, partial [Candidatus Acidoferrales bacterium]|nr:GNAT family N-acetyltransferase [Candidatus Acidoferrales bacterium]